MLEYIILGHLMFAEKSGYDLKVWMANSTSNFFDASFGSIYPALKRLEAKEFIKSREIVEGSKYKKMYSINDAGRKEFLSWLEAPIHFARTKQDHLVKIFFYDLLPKEKATENLEDLVRQVEPILEYLEGHKENLEQNFDRKRYAFQFSTIYYGIGYYQFIINWCIDLIKSMTIG